MVGTDGVAKFDDPKGRACLCSDPLNPDGESGICSLDCKLERALVDGKLNGKNLSALCPITPNPCGENVDSISLTDSPLSSESPKSPNVDGFTSTESDGIFDNNNSPRTPEESIFDPFAPGPEELLLAPFCKKLVKGYRKIVARRLNFDDDDDDFTEAGENAKEVEMLCEKTILDTVYGTLLEAIVEDFLAENQSQSQNLIETPTFSPPPSFTGIAETCPRAPMKAIATKSRNIDPGLCRKLEF